MSARQQMTMRATWQRNESTPNVYSLPGPPNWKTVHDSIPCFVWVDSATMQGQTGPVEISEPKAMVQKSQDFKMGDRFESVKDRVGNVLFGVMTIESVALRSDHKELRLKQIA